VRVISVSEILKTQFTVTQYFVLMKEKLFEIVSFKVVLNVYLK